jgi:hypothetical protein
MGIRRAPGSSVPTTRISYGSALLVSHPSAKYAEGWGTHGQVMPARSNPAKPGPPAPWALLLSLLESDLQCPPLNESASGCLGHLPIYQYEGAADLISLGRFVSEVNSYRSKGESRLELRSPYY